MYRRSDKTLSLIQEDMKKYIAELNDEISVEHLKHLAMAISEIVKAVNVYIKEED